MLGDTEIRKLAQKLKEAVSTKSSKHMQLRKGRRPIRVDTLLKNENVKTSSQSGADLRIPLMGGTKFPTNDSTSEARKKLKQHQSIGVPPPPKTQGVKDLVPTFGVDVMPKVGSDMSIENDPLIQYLKKEASDPPTVETGNWPKGDRPFDKGELVGQGDMSVKTDKEVKPLVDEDPTQMNKDFPAKETVSDWKSYLSQMFANKSGITKKCGEKDYPHKSGTVESIAKR